MTSSYFFQELDLHFCKSNFWIKNIVVFNTIELVRTSLTLNNEFVFSTEHRSLLSQLPLFIFIEWKVFLKDNSYFKKPNDYSIICPFQSCSNVNRFAKDYQVVCYSFRWNCKHILRNIILKYFSQRSWNLNAVSC